MGEREAGALDHIVVVMMENRSFDHLFAYLDGPPAWAPEFDNPAGPLAPGTVVPLSPDGSYSMPLDPPHSHPAALESFAVGPTGRFHMTGFVAAAARKAVGQDDPVIHHWVRQAVAAVAVTGGIALAVRAATDGAARAWAARGWLASVGLVAAVQVARRRADRRRLTRRRTDEEKADAVARAKAVMACMTPDKLPVLATLAREFTLCRRWFCSVPGETWPNRTFLHCGTSEGTVEIEPGFTVADTVFERLEEGRVTREERDRAWRIYVDGGIPHVSAFPRLWGSDERHSRWSPLADFERDVEAGRLPAYSFIEPRHQQPASNSQHPGNNRRQAASHESDFERGEHLIAYVYEALRRRPEVFNRTLLIVTYDENGGLFDHERPPRTVAPKRIGRPHWSRQLIAFFVERHRYPFTFRLLGARVPTLVISPLVPSEPNDTEFDHTTIPATVRTLFAPATEPLSRREARANRLTDHLRLLDEPRSDLPDLSAYAARHGVVSERALAFPVDETAAPAEQDLFNRQLDALAANLRDALPERGGPRTAFEVSPDARVAAGPHADVVVRLLGSPRSP